MQKQLWELGKKCDIRYLMSGKIEVQTSLAENC